MADIKRSTTENSQSFVMQTQYQRVLVIGASSGIAQAVIQTLLNDSQAEVIGCSRMSESDAKSQIKATNEGINNTTLQRYRHFSVRAYDTESIAQVLAQLPKASIDLAVCCLGVLHDEALGLSPEKRIEELNEQSLLRYFQINTVTPSLWLQGLLPHMVKGQQSKIVLLSARVGSITDNSLGGWYGYRASKSALNMMVKTAQVEFSRRAKLCSLVLYHPGTVDTRLSKPFQANVPPHKLFTPEFTARQLLHYIDDLNSEFAPFYIDWQGKTIPW